MDLSTPFKRYIEFILRKDTCVDCVTIGIFIGLGLQVALMGHLITLADDELDDEDPSKWLSDAAAELHQIFVTSDKERLCRFILGLDMDLGRYIDGMSNDQLRQVCTGIIASIRNIKDKT